MLSRGSYEARLGRNLIITDTKLGFCERNSGLFDRVGVGTLDLREINPLAECLWSQVIKANNPT
jgi:hypothetical protein